MAGSSTRIDLAQDPSFGEPAAPPPMSSERESRHGGGAILPNIIARLLESVEEKISKSYIAI
jgi:hypothetical protein